MINQEPVKVNIELMSNEIEMIIEDIQRVPYILYKDFGYEKIIKKLNMALDEAYKQKEDTD